MDQPTAEETLRRVTGRPSTDEAVRWIATGYHLLDDASPHAALQALVALPASADTEQAIRVLTPRVASSDLDTATILYGGELLPDPEDYTRALDTVAAAAGGSLAAVDAQSLRAAQRAHPGAIEALALAAGLSYDALQAKVDALPTNPRGTWWPEQVESAHKVIDEAVRGTTGALPEGAMPVRALELIVSDQSGADGWAMLEHARTRGVPLGLLLAQRVVGGTWLAHRNRTSGRVSPSVAASLCRELDAREIHYLRSTQVGGEQSPKHIADLTGSDRQLAVVALDGGAPAFGVVFSAARDGGTAHANAGKLRAMRRPASLPVGVVVIGPGWAQRNETAQLASDFGGRLYADGDLPVLADHIAAAISTSREET